MDEYIGKTAMNFFCEEITQPLFYITKYNIVEYLAYLSKCNLDFFAKYFCPEFFAADDIFSYPNGNMNVARMIGKIFFGLKCNEKRKLFLTKFSKFYMVKKMVINYFGPYTYRVVMNSYGHVSDILVLNENTNWIELCTREHRFSDKSKWYDVRQELLWSPSVGDFQ